MKKDEIEAGDLLCEVRFSVQVPIEEPSKIIKNKYNSPEYVMNLTNCV